MSTARSPNRLSAMRFVVAFGVVSLLADFVYEGARSIAGPFLATFGASAGLVGFITGAGEAIVRAESQKGNTVLSQAKATFKA